MLSRGGATLLRASASGCDSALAAVQKHPEVERDLGTGLARWCRVQRVCAPRALGSTFRAPPRNGEPRLLRRSPWLRIRSVSWEPTVPVTWMQAWVFSRM